MTRHAHLPLAVVALGGNALLRRGQTADGEHQRANAERAARAIAELSGEMRIVLTHGNGPQVGLLAQQAAALHGVEPAPLDVLDAESEGQIGYVLQQALRNELPTRDVVTVLTQIVVDRYDPAFQHPTKPIGLVYDEATARRLAHAGGWSIAPDGDGFRRVVPSPEPVAVVELGAIRRLVEQDVLVICAGGGGIPVCRTQDGKLEGVEAVIDKDRAAAAALADQLGASELIMLTDVPAVVSGWGTDHARPYRTVSAATLAEEPFAAGSMGPKVEAARRFVANPERIARIGSLDQAVATARGTAGTTVTAAGETNWWPQALPV